MNRRRFLKFLGVGAAAGVVAPHVLLQKVPASVAPVTWPNVPSYNTMGLEPEGGWVSYRFHYTVTRPPIRPWRLRHIDAVA